MRVWGICKESTHVARSTRLPVAGIEPGSKVADARTSCVAEVPRLRSKIIDLKRHGVQGRPYLHFVRLIYHGRRWHPTSTPLHAFSTLWFRQ